MDKEEILNEENQGCGECNETPQEEISENSVPETEQNTESDVKPEEPGCSMEDELLEKLAKLNDSHLRLMADFDNYKKKTLKEKSDLIKYGGEGIIKNLLPIIDDFERALANMPEEENPVKEGVVLIHGKFMGFLKQCGVKEIAAVGEAFDTDYHEAVTMFPAADEQQKGKVIDCIQKGYMFYDKVIRYAKVVVAQ